jgi:hypothetical protein
VSERQELTPHELALYGRVPSLIYCGRFLNLDISRKIREKLQKFTYNKKHELYQLFIDAGEADIK